MPADEIPNVQDLELEASEMEKDLAAFVSARELVRARILEVKDQERWITPLPRWSGTDAVTGSLDLAIHAMERTIQEIRQIIEALKKNRKFRVIQGEEDG